ncbi:hypothetical protein ACEQ8H_007684 [Pleosporales sp. CAS-2024a]
MHHDDAGDAGDDAAAVDAGDAPHALAALLAAFRQLHSPPARRAALDALARELTPHEWRRLQHVAAARSFQLDIVALLPLELVARVFAHLDPAAPFRLQRVSPRWRHVLRSPALLTQTLAAWYGSSPALLQADYAVCRAKAQAIHAFRHARPRHHLRLTKIKAPGTSAILVRHTLVLRAWEGAALSSRTLHLLDMHTWRLHSLAGDAREAISHIFASDQIAGFTTETHVCYVSDHQGHGKRRFRVPSAALLQAIACRARTVACAGCLHDCAQVYIWDYDTHQGTSFSISFNSHLFPFPRLWRNHTHGMALLLQPTANRLLVFTDRRCSGGNGFDESYCQAADHDRAAFRYAQFDYQGQCIFESQLAKDPSHEEQHAFFQNTDNYFTPVDDQGTFKISIGSYNHVPSTRWIQFDERANQFTQPIAAKDAAQMSASRSHFWWKDTMYSSAKTTYQVNHMPAPSYLTYMGTRYPPHS